MNILPKDIKLYITQYFLTSRDFFNLLMICKSWNKDLQNDVVWRKFYLLNEGCSFCEPLRLMRSKRIENFVYSEALDARFFIHENKIDCYFYFSKDDNWDINIYYPVLIDIDDLKILMHD